MKNTVSVSRAQGRLTLTRMAGDRGWSALFLALALQAVLGVAQANVGRAPGEFHVNQLGAATYTIPIWVPRGPNGLQPQIALTYNSQNGGGYVGVGWALAGISSIARCNRTTAQDGTPAVVALSTTDAFCLDGARLQLTGGSNGVAGSTYQTEIANFEQITAYGSAGNGPAYFVVQAPDGTQYEYGNDLDGAGSQVLANGTSTAMQWYLDEVKDPAGNTMTVSYTAGTGSAVPKEISWTPSSHGATTYAYTMDFAYGTNSPASSIYGYVAGTAVANSSLLQSITINYNGATVKKYALTYQQSQATGAEEVAQLQECADSAETNCLSPTTFSYQGATQPGVVASATAGPNAPGILVWNYDFDGDGSDDLAFCTGGAGGGVVEVSFASSSGYGPPINTGIPCETNGTVSALFGDILGNHQDGILGVNNGTWYYYQWNGSSFVGQSTGVSYQVAYQYVLADVTGDGLPALVEMNYSSGTETLTIDVRLNTSSGSTPSFSATNAQWWSSSFSSGTVGFWANLQSTSDGQAGSIGTGALKHLDFNGDGRDDLALEYQVMTCLIIRNVCHDQYSDNGVELVSTGSGFTATQIAHASTMAGPVFKFLKFNSDACTDFLYNSVIYVSGCNGSPAAQVTVPSSNVMGSMDWNGDGRTDILVNNGGTIGVYESTGTGLTGLITTSIPYSSTSQYFGFDPDGDGLDALGVWQWQASPFGVSYYAHNGVPPDLLASITDGYGNTVKAAYVSLSQGVGSTYTRGNDAALPYANYTGTMYVVSGVTYSDPSNPGSTYQQTHYYSDAWINEQGRGFAGFKTHSVYDSRNKLYVQQTFDQTFPATGMLLAETVTEGSATGQTVSSLSNTLKQITLSSAPGSQRSFDYVSAATTKQYEVGGTENGALITTKTDSYAEDNYGNLTSSTETVTDNDVGSPSPYYGDSWTTTITNTVEADGQATPCLRLLTEQQISYTATTGASVTRTRTFTPDNSLCVYSDIVTEPQSAYQVTEALHHDSFGNIDTDTVTGNNMAARVTSANWGTTGQFPVIIQDPIAAADGYEEQIGYDYSVGLKINDVIQTTSGVQDSPPTQWSYDPFGRVVKETRPDGTSTAFGYSLYSGADTKPRMLIAVQPRDTSGNVISTTTQELDMEDRPYLTEVQLLDGSTDTVMQKGYDSLGRVISQQVPYEGGQVGEETLSYDVLNRLTETQSPTSASASATTGYAYAGRTTTITDANGNAKTLIHDVNGWLRETKDATGYAITLGYDAAGGHTLTTDNQGNQLWSGTVQYGMAAFTTAATDADLGAWQYTYDALGEVTNWTDAKGQSFSAKYDALSRMTDRYEPDLYSHWIWGSSAAAHNIGQLLSACTGTGANPTACSTSGYAESEAYDSVGRPSQRSIAIPGDATYTYTQTYNAEGLPDTMTYPASTAGYALAIKFGYAYGLLKSITDTSDSPTVNLWTANAMNARGQYTQETFGNGVVVNHAFDFYRGLLQSITAGLGGGAALQNNSYLYDPVGNLIQRQDNNAGANESVYYDSLNRLSYTVGDSNTKMSYDSMGRIATWEAYGNSTNVNDYTTPQSGCSYYANSQPHAVRKSTQGSSPPGSVCYDANGNETTESSSGSVNLSLTWMSFNQPTAMSAGSSYSNLYYDEDHQRFEQIASYSGSPEDTEYIGGLMEKMANSSGTAYRYYIPAGNNFIVYNRWLSGTNAIYYATKDNIDSTAVITDSKGVQAVAEKFSALGWGENNPQAIIASITRHEFTGQEMLNNLGMVNLNARVYQPSGGRFYSPDPKIPDS
ncbi:MAG TPA: SpvB/TcaC N-terminal domain-containing protein, partial [Steroidobacteraceae bacterium]|nr:SpvB/TcaC N-terminal domain-containing protein [Steroidobacteraceae bacterium]